MASPLSPPPPPESQPDVSPSILLAIIILAIIFFFSGLLHLLLRLFLKPTTEPHHPGDAAAAASAFQGQLQQLFHLHDAGVDQSFIDTLPVFLYKAIIGLKLDPFDCSVCLCEFQPHDKLRLLTKCSHAFHMDCIDTWLLTHSTCPLCRASLIPDFAAINGGLSPPIVGVLESANTSARGIAIGSENEIPAGSFLGFLGDAPNFTESKGDEAPAAAAAEEEKVVPIKLGKFRNLEQSGSNGESSSNVGSRRCFSMGSFGYVMDESSSLRVPIRTPAARRLARKPVNRAAMSECDCESRREFSFSESNRRGESFRLGKGAGAGAPVEELARRAFSFHFPGNWSQPRSESGAETTGDEENQNRDRDRDRDRRNSTEIVGSRRSFVRRTMVWLMGRNSRIVDASSMPNDVSDDSFTL